MGKIKCLIAISIMIVLTACSTTLPPEQVKLEQGIVQGTVENGLPLRHLLLENYAGVYHSPLKNGTV